MARLERARLPGYHRPLLRVACRAGPERAFHPRSELLDADLRAQGGERIGEAEDVVANIASGQISYVVVEFDRGWFSEDKLVALPLRALNPVRERGVFTSDLVQRWILARLRNRQFFCLEELNAAIHALLVELNTRPFKKLEGCRQSAFEAIDRPAMKPLPPTRYDFAEWKTAIVNIDYHVDAEGHYYSVPHRLVKQKVEVRITATTVECFYHGKRVAAHLRSWLRGRHTTVGEHMPDAHRKHLEWTPGRLLNWALSIGPATRDVVQWQFDHRPHPPPSTLHRFPPRTSMTERLSTPGQNSSRTGGRNSTRADT